MTLRSIRIAAALAVLGVPILGAGLAAQEHEVPEPPEPREVREAPDVREAPEPREVEVREVEVREVEPREVEAKEDSESGKSGESRDEGVSSEIGWQADAFRDEGADRDETGNPVRQGEVIAFALPAEAEQRLAASGYRVISRKALAALGGDVVRLGVPRGRSLAAAVREVREAATGAVIDYDHYYGLGLAGRARGKRDRKAAVPEAEPQGFAVGMIDTAVAAHPALGAARVVAWPGGDPAAAASAMQHGTAVASLLAARGAGTIYSANIFRGPAGRPFTSIDSLVEAMEWLLGQNAPVINMSLAGPPNALLQKMVAVAGGRGRIIVAAAGNGGPAAAPVYPAALPGVVAVTAVDPALRVYRYANHGRYIGVAAQGVGVLAAAAAGGFARFTGTSFAAPHIAARLARCRAAGGASAVCIESLRKAARDLGAPGFDETYGHGYVE
jgi:subtilisin family serine protease